MSVRRAPTLPRTPGGCPRPPRGAAQDASPRSPARHAKAGSMAPSPDGVGDDPELLADAVVVAVRAVRQLVLEHRSWTGAQRLEARAEAHVGAGDPDLVEGVLRACARRRCSASLNTCPRARGAPPSTARSRSRPERTEISAMARSSSIADRRDLHVPGGGEDPQQASRLGVGGLAVGPTTKSRRRLRRSAGC